MDTLIAVLIASNSRSMPTVIPISSSGNPRTPKTLASITTPSPGVVAVAMEAITADETIKPVCAGVNGMLNYRATNIAESAWHNCKSGIALP